MTPKTPMENNNDMHKRKTRTSLKATVEEIPDEGGAGAEDSILGDSIPGKWKRGFT